MPLQGTPDWGQVEEPDRQAARAAAAAAAAALASALAAKAAAQHSLDVANQKLANVVTATQTYSGALGNGSYQNLMTVSLDNVVGPCIVLAHGQLQTNCNMRLVDGDGNVISQQVFTFNTKQGTLGVFIACGFGISAFVSPDVNGTATASLQGEGPVNAQAQIDIVGFQLNVVP